MPREEEGRLPLLLTVPAHPRGLLGKELIDVRGAGDHLPAWTPEVEARYLAARLLRHSASCCSSDWMVERRERQGGQRAWGWWSLRNMLGNLLM